MNKQLSIFFGTIALVLSLMAIDNSDLTKEQIQQIGIDAYIYGYPLVTMDLTKQVMTNVKEPTDTRAPLGQFANAKSYPDATFVDVTAPNADTLYSVAWLDLSIEPYVLHTPNMLDRYYLMPMLSGWTEVFHTPGTRTVSSEEEEFVITGPFWKGKVPDDLKEIKSPTNMVWIIGRTYSTGTDLDYKIVHSLQDRYRLEPLSFYQKPYRAPLGTVNPNIDMKTPVKTQVNALDSLTFFQRLAELLKDNPPANGDNFMIQQMAKIGLISGQPFSFKNPAYEDALKDVPALALAKIIEQSKKQPSVNGWELSFDTGNYGKDYLQRAYITLFGLGANRPQDAVYPFTSVDKNGQPLNGQNNYTLTFGKGETPPVKGFWSLTLYNDQLFFSENPIDRYSISQRNGFKYNPDGSLTLFIQNESPGIEWEPNWLPSPKGPFSLMLRLYWPEQSILSGNWLPPPIKKN